MHQYQFAEAPELLARIGSGDEQALGELYDRYHRQCFAFALRILGSESDAEDAVQESFVRVWRNGGRFDSSRASVTTWLFSIVRNICIDELRRRRNRMPAENVEDVEIVSDAHTEGEVELAMLGEEVRKELAELPADQRRAIELVYFQGLTSSEVGTLLEVPAGTVRSRLRLGLLKLGSIFESKGVTR